MNDLRPHRTSVRKEVDTLLKQFDHNKSGDIQVTGKVNNFFKQFESSDFRFPGIDYSCRDLFEAADTNRDGTATRAELTKVVASFDTNRDGQLSRTEAEAYATKFGDTMVDSTESVLMQGAVIFAIPAVMMAL